MLSQFGSWFPFTFPFCLISKSFCGPCLGFTMSPPTVEQRRRLSEHNRRLSELHIEAICPGSLAKFSAPTTQGPTALAHFDHIEETDAWPAAIMSHLKYTGHHMSMDPNTIHASRVVQSVSPERPGTCFILKSTWTAPDRSMDKIVSTPLMYCGRGHLEEPKEPRVFLENSLTFDRGTRQAVESFGAEWDRASDVILTWLDDEGFCDEVGSVIPDGRVFSAGVGTDAVIIEYVLPTDVPTAVRWRFPKEGHVRNTHSRRSSAVSGGQGRSRR